MLETVRAFFRHHTTKLLGFSQVTVGALAVADQQMIAAVFGPDGLRWIILTSGVLTAWRGFVNTQYQQQPPNDPS
jgi:hypothetical protein